MITMNDEPYMVLRNLMRYIQSIVKELEYFKYVLLDKFIA
jgi:hypothetical protein